MRRRLALLLIAVPFLAPAQEAVLVHPGSWEVMPPAVGGAVLSYRLCLARGDAGDLAQLLPQGGIAGCPAPSPRIADGNLDWVLDCPSRRLRIEARYAFTAESLQGTVTTSRDGRDNAEVQRISARRIGACTPP